MHKGGEIPQARIRTAESERKVAELLDIKARVERYGAHKAREHEDRARQFMPFAALKGYDGLIEQAHRQKTAMPEMTEEQARYLSELVYSLEKGTLLHIRAHIEGACRKISGIYEGIDDANHALIITVPSADSAKAAAAGGLRNKVRLESIVSIEKGDRDDLRPDMP